MAGKTCANIEGGTLGCVVVFAAFNIQVLTFGTCKAIGLYNIELLRHFDEGAAAVSLVGSINFGMFLGAGPLASLLMARWSHRQVALAGSALAGIGLVCMPFAPNLGYMYVFYGFVTGLGYCLAFVPSLVLCGLYFSEHRSLATGAAIAGSGLGAVVSPLIIHMVIEHYGWRGSLFIIAGLNLHLIIFSALLFPVPPKLQRFLALQEALKDTEDDSSNTRNVTEFGSINKAFDSTDDTTKVRGVISKCNGVQQPTDSSIVAEEIACDGITQSDKYTAENQECHRKYIGDRKCDKITVSSDLKHAGVDGTVGQTLVLGDVSTIYKYEPAEVTNNNTFALEDMTRTEETLQNKSAADIQVATTRVRLTKHVHSVCRVDFIIYCLNCICWNTAWTAFLQFVPEYSLSIGLEKDNVSIVLMAIGIGSTLGNVLGGILGNMKCINTITLCILANLGCGVASLMTIPEASHSLVGLLAICLLYGLLMGIILSLLVVVTSDLLGIDAMSAGFGYLMFANGLGAGIGPPIAGSLIDAYGHVNLAMYVVGIFSILGGLIMCLVPIRRKCQRVQSTTE